MFESPGRVEVTAPFLSSVRFSLTIYPSLPLQMNPVLRLSSPLILASQSPRRRTLLDRLDLSFRVVVSPADEGLANPGPPPTVVQKLAARKARPVAAEHPSALVLAADTVVAQNEEILNKPETPDHARRMLRRLRETTHTVYTGIALVHRETSRETTAVEGTDVAFGKVSDPEIDAYVASGSPMDKAGAYGIQDHTGALFVERIEGDYYNVVGLPLRRLYRTVQRDYEDLLDPPQS